MTKRQLNAIDREIETNNFEFVGNRLTNIELRQLVYERRYLETVLMQLRDDIGNCESFNELKELMNGVAHAIAHVTKIG